jgi:hypothetical protein
MKIIERELLSEIKKDRAIEEQHGDLSSRLNVKNPQFNYDNRPNTRGGFVSRGRGRGRGPPKV